MNPESNQSMQQQVIQQQLSLPTESTEKNPNKEQGDFTGENSSKKLKKESILSELKITKQKFKNFQAFISLMPQIDNKIKDHYDRLHDDILFKKFDSLNLACLSDQFETILQKAQNNFRTSKKNWNEEETIFLISVVTYWTYIKKEDHKKIPDESWREIASVIPRRNMEQIKQRWNNLLKIYISKDPWTPEEDKLIATIIESMKDGIDWKNVVKELNLRNPMKIYRSAKQCRERWNNHIDPCINRGPWIKEQDLKLLNCYLEIGKKWSQIAKELSNRTENAVKNRWHSLMRRVGLVNNGSFENSETEESEKAKQLIKLIMNGTIYEKGDKATSGDEQLSPQVKKEEFYEKDRDDDEEKADDKDDENDEEDKESHEEDGTIVQQSAIESNTRLKKSKRSSEKLLNKQMQVKKDNATSDIDEMLDKIRKGKDLANFPSQGAIEPKVTIHMETPENQLLRNLSYVSNPKPTLQSFGELPQPASFFNPGTTTLSLESNSMPPIVQLNHFGNAVNYQFPSNFPVPFLNNHGNLFPLQTQQSVARGIGPITTQIPSIANGYHLYGYQQHQRPISHSIVSETRSAVPFDLRNGQELQKGPLIRSLSEFEANSKAKSTLSSNDTDLNLKVKKLNLNLFNAEGLQMHRNRYQFAILDKEDNGLFLLDPVSTNSLQLLKELTKNHESTKPISSKQPYLKTVYFK